MPSMRHGSTLVSPPMTTTTTLKLPRSLKARMARVAKKTGRSPHGFMLEAIERQTSHEERMEAFVKEALAADRAIEKRGEVYAAEDVHAWIARLAQGQRPARPRPWRG